MYCARCGAQNNPIAQYCEACHAPLLNPNAPPTVAEYQAVPQVPTYLVHAIICTVLCCMPFGIAAIVYASLTMSHNSAGRYAEAMKTSRLARTWCWVSFGIGLACIGAYAVLVAIGMAVGP